MAGVGVPSRHGFWDVNAGTKTDPVLPVLPLPRGIVTGITARSWEQAMSSGFTSKIDSMVLEFPMRDSVLKDGSGNIVLVGGEPSLDPAWKAEMHSRLTWCMTHTGTTGFPIKVSWRPRAGIYFPRGVPGVEYVTWYSRKGSADTGLTSIPDPLTAGFFRLIEPIPLCWVDQTGSSTSRDAWAAMLLKIEMLYVLEFGTAYPCILEADMARFCTQYPEPKVWQMQSVSNFGFATSRGYTKEKVADSMRVGWDIWAQTWAPLRVSCYTSYNPPGAIDYTLVPPKFKNGFADLAIRDMETQHNISQRMCVWANKSLNNAQWNKGFQAQIYNRQKLGALSNVPPILSRYQTETFINLAKTYLTEGSNTVDTIETCIELGGTSVEPPTGCQDASNPWTQLGVTYYAASYPKMYITDAQALDWNTRMLALAAGKYTP